VAAQRTLDVVGCFAPYSTKMVVPPFRKIHFSIGNGLRGKWITSGAFGTGG
jgi:hypothetical protein